MSGGPGWGEPLHMSADVEAVQRALIASHTQADRPGWCPLCRVVAPCELRLRAEYDLTLAGLRIEPPSP